MSRRSQPIDPDTGNVVETSTDLAARIDALEKFATAVRTMARHMGLQLPELD